jgi:O-antigen ligase
LLSWDMVAETVTWFSSRTGEYSPIPIRVRGRSSGTSPYLAAALPSTPPQPERTVLWAAALRMIRAHPVFGVGPDGYRLNYGRYALPPTRNWDQRIFANSLPLELAADLGIPGAILFFAFLLVACRPLLGALRRSEAGIWAVATAAALAVFLAHGLVDYLLGAHAVAILLWLLLGMASMSSIGIKQGDFA